MRMAENSPASVIGSLEPFDPETDNWPAYIERLEQFFSVNNIVDEKKVATLVTVIGKKAYNLLRSLLAPEKPSTKSYDRLVQAIQSYLDPQPLAIAQCFKFHQRNQKSDETISQFVAELASMQNIVIFTISLMKHSEIGWCVDYVVKQYKNVG